MQQLGLVAGGEAVAAHVDSLPVMLDIRVAREPDAPKRLSRLVVAMLRIIHSERWIQGDPS